MTDELRTGQRRGIPEQNVVHLPESALVPGAMCCFRRLASLWVQLVDGEVAEDISHLAGRDVLGLQGRQGCGEEPLAERALIVGELDNGYRRIGAAQIRRICDGRA